MVLKYEDISPLPHLVQNFFPKTSHSTRQIVDVRFSDRPFDPSTNHLCTNFWSGDIGKGILNLTQPQFFKGSPKP